MKPEVLRTCVASAHAAPNERIVEFHSAAPSGPGGLISFRDLDGRLRVDLYRLDAEVDVSVDAERLLLPTTTVERGRLVLRLLAAMRAEPDDPGDRLNEAILDAAIATITTRFS